VVTFGTFLPLRIQFRSSIFSKGDAEKQFVRGRDRHTADTDQEFFYRLLSHHCGHLTVDNILSSQLPFNHAVMRSDEQAHLHRNRHIDDIEFSA
jgi:hypothetical protein